jgi:hypothetical protein
MLVVFVRIGQLVTVQFMNSTFAATVNDTTLSDIFLNYLFPVYLEPELVDLPNGALHIPVPVVNPESTNPIPASTEPGFMLIGPGPSIKFQTASLGSFLRNGNAAGIRPCIGTYLARY